MESLTRTRSLALLTLVTVGIAAGHSIFRGLPAGDAGAAYPVFTECSDGIDNDNDFLIDYPADFNCANLEDDSEGPDHSGVFVEVDDGLNLVDAGGNVTYTVTLSTDRPEQKLVNVRFLMPHQTNVIDIDSGGRQEGPYILWHNVAVQPGDVRMLHVSVHVDPHAQEGLLLTTQATADGTSASDTTRVTTDRQEDNGRRSPAVRLAITDGRQYAQPTEILTYSILAKNITAVPQTVTVHTTLSSYLQYLSATRSPWRDGRDIQWQDQVLAPHEEREYTVTVAVQREAVDFQVIRTRVGAGAASATDSTSIHTSALPVDPRSLSLQVNDGYTQTVPGELITYQIDLQNNTNVLGTEIDVNNALPSHTEFVSATEGGYWNGQRVRWDNLTVAPLDSRQLFVTARVRSDAPLGHRLQNRVESKGQHAVDRTEIGRQPMGHAMGARQQGIVLRKFSDRPEVRPGDMVRYTVVLKNNTEKPLTNVTIEDRMDLRYMRVVGSEGGAMQGDRIVWTAEHIAPGAEWVAHYTAAIDPRTPHGIEIKNVVTASGHGMERVALTQRVFTGSLGVVRSLPPTGAAWDAIFVALIGMLGAAQTFFLRRKFVCA